MKFSIKLSTFLLLTTAPVIAEELIVLDEITVTAGYTDTESMKQAQVYLYWINKSFSILQAGLFKRLKMLRVFRWIQLVD